MEGATRPPVEWHFDGDIPTFQPDLTSQRPRAWERVPISPHTRRRKGRKVWKRYEFSAKDLHTGDTSQGATTEATEEEGAQKNTSQVVKRLRVKEDGDMDEAKQKPSRYIATLRERNTGTPKRKTLRRKSLKPDKGRSKRDNELERGQKVDVALQATSSSKPKMIHEISDNPLLSTACPKREDMNVAIDPASITNTTEKFSDDIAGTENKLKVQVDVEEAAIDEFDEIHHEVTQALDGDNGTLYSNKFTETFHISPTELITRCKEVSVAAGANSGRADKNTSPRRYTGSPEAVGESVTEQLEDINPKSDTEKVRALVNTISSQSGDIPVASEETADLDTRSAQALDDSLREDTLTENVLLGTSSSGGDINIRRPETPFENQAANSFNGAPNNSRKNRLALIETSPSPRIEVTEQSLQEGIRDHDCLETPFVKRQPQEDQSARDLEDESSASAREDEMPSATMKSEMLEPERASAGNSTSSVLTQLVDPPNPEPSSEPVISKSKTRSATRFSDDTSILKDFLSRAQARKQAKEAKHASEPPPLVSTPRRSPRKALMNIDRNSPSPHKKRDLVNRPGTPPGKEKLGTFSLEEMEEVPGETSPVRRSSRKRLQPPAKTTPGAPSFIPVRRADGTDPVVLPKTVAQELAMVTRANTRRNKGQSKPPALTLKTLTTETGEVIQIAGSGQNVEGAKSVGWDENLVYYQERKADEEQEIAEEKRPQVQRLRGLGASNGTPAPKRMTTDLCSTSGTRKRQGRKR
ncbi:MAG: hypothetical protein Q9167_006067 [Letrouitia subvulpina]